MKQNRTTTKYKKKAIGLDNRYNTNWKALGALAFAAFITGLTQYALAYEESILKSELVYIQEEKVTKKPEPRIVKIITTQEWEAQQAEEQWKQNHLAKLRKCESGGDDGIIGDAGESVGPYQWQKTTLEDKIGRKVTNKEWLMMVTDYEFIHELTYKTYFEDGEWWRWYNCSVALGYSG